MNATSPAGAVVSYVAPSASADCSQASVICLPASGSVFPIGSNNVICTAYNFSTNTTSCGFLVTVLGAPEQITKLIALVESFSVKKEPKRELIEELQAALKALNRHDQRKACNHLKEFVEEVREHHRKQLTPDQATQLIDEAKRIRAVLGC